MIPALVIAACSSAPGLEITGEATIEAIDATWFVMRLDYKDTPVSACGFRAKLPDGRIVLFRTDSFNSSHTNSRRLCGLLKTGDKIPVVWHNQTHKWLHDANDAENQKGPLFQIF